MDAYSLGNDNYSALMIAWAFSSFILLIHLLNMLIAIMGETFAVNNEVKDIQTLRSHLQFVMDNWWIEPIDDKQTIKYLITAFKKEDENQEQEMIGEMMKKQEHMQEMLVEQFDEVTQKLAELKIKK